MRRVTLSLVVLAIVGLAASTALAGTSSPKVSLTLAAHHGSHGYGHGHHSYRYGHHPRSYHPYRRSGPVIVRPIVPPPPALIYPYPSYYRYQPYYYGPSGGIHYQGRGFGISIGF